MLYGASGGLVALGVVFMTQGSTRLVGVFWLLAAVILAFGTWRKRRAGKAAHSAGPPAPGPASPGQ